jgi:dTDP-glucose 4,6-dehydratase
MIAIPSEAAKMRNAFSRSGIDDAELRILVHENQSLFGPLAGASLLITGGTGWFGVWLLDSICIADDMLELGVKITAVSRDPAAFLRRFPGFSGDSRITWIKSDVRRLDARGRGFSHIIHAAADTAAPSSPDSHLQLFETILDGTRQAIAAAGPGCKSVLLLSSGAVYGPAQPGCGPFAESAAGGPDCASIKNTYAEAKRAAEQRGAIAATMGVPVRIARCFAFVGPHMPFDRHFAIGNFIADAVEGRKISVRSDGRPQRSYLYMSDLMRALLVILISGAVGRPYNVGSDRVLTIEQLAHCVDRVVGGAGVTIEGAASDPGDRYVPDMTRLKTELKFAPQVPLEAAIARTAAWYRARIAEPMPS